MTRASKRKSDVLISSPAKTPRAVAARYASVSNKASKKGCERIDEFFKKYADKTSGIIEPEGIEALCSDLEVNYTDFRILILAWKMDAQKQGYFTQTEWRRGLKALRVDNINKLKKSLQELKDEAVKCWNFEDLYKFGFQYCFTVEMQRCLDMETTCVLVDMILGPHYRLQVNLFMKYLKFQSEYKAITMDQWMNFLRFCREISFPDLDNYDACEAWPLLIDNFVDWLKEAPTRALKCLKPWTRMSRFETVIGHCSKGSIS